MPSKRKARIVRERGEKIDAEMNDTVAERLASGEELTAFHADLLSREREGKAELTPHERNSLSGTSRVFFLDSYYAQLSVVVGASVDTTTASLMAVVLALVCAVLDDRPISYTHE